MDEFLIQLSILGPALLAGIVVLATHVILGQEVLRRGIIFLDLAIAQVAAFGLILAGALGLDMQHSNSHTLLPQMVAFAAAIGGASVLYLFRTYAAQLQEALIGTLFILAATGSALLLSKDPHGGERLNEILNGQILWVEYSSLTGAAIISAAVLILWLAGRNQLGNYLFYPLFAIAITLSTQLVGVYLVFASLIIPAIASQNRCKPLLTAYSVGVLGYLCGLVLSTLLDFPSGPMIAWSLAGVALLIYLISPKNCQNEVGSQSPPIS